MATTSSSPASSVMDRQMTRLFLDNVMMPSAIAQINASGSRGVVKLYLINGQANMDAEYINTVHTALVPALTDKFPQLSFLPATVTDDGTRKEICVEWYHNFFTSSASSLSVAPSSPMGVNLGPKPAVAEHDYEAELQKLAGFIVVRYINESTRGLSNLTKSFVLPIDRVYTAIDVFETSVPYATRYTVEPHYDLFSKETCEYFRKGIVDAICDKLVLELPKRFPGVTFDKPRIVRICQSYVIQVDLASKTDSSLWKDSSTIFNDDVKPI